MKRPCKANSETMSVTLPTGVEVIITAHAVAPKPAGRSQKGKPAQHRRATFGELISAFRALSPQAAPITQS